MIELAEFCEKVGFQDVLSEKCHEYLVEKESIGIQIQKPMGMLLRFLRMCLANGEPLDHASKVPLSIGMNRMSMKPLAITITALRKFGDSCSI